jgi:hypothetical protein
MQLRQSWPLNAWYPSSIERAKELLADYKTRKRAQADAQRGKGKR